MNSPTHGGNRDIGNALVISNDPDYCRAPKDIVPDNI